MYLFVTISMAWCDAALEQEKRCDAMLPNNSCSVSICCQKTAKNRKMWSTCSSSSRTSSLCVFLSGWRDLMWFRNCTKTVSLDLFPLLDWLVWWCGVDLLIWWWGLLSDRCVFNCLLLHVLLGIFTFSVISGHLFSFLFGRWGRCRTSLIVCSWQQGAFM